MKKILNIYHRRLGNELLGSVYTYEEFVLVKFNQRFHSQPFTYSEYIERVKKATADGYYFEDGRETKN